VLLRSGRAAVTGGARRQPGGPGGIRRGCPSHVAGTTWMWHPRRNSPGRTWYGPYGRCRSDARPVWRLRGGPPRRHAGRYRGCGIRGSGAGRRLTDPVASAARQKRAAGPRALVPCLLRSPDVLVVPGGGDLRHGGGWPPLTSAAVPATLPSRVMVSSASAWPSTYRSKKASVTRAVRRSTGFVPSYGIRWLAPNRSR